MGTTLVAGLFGLGGVVLGNNIRIGSLNFGGTEYDRPLSGSVPRNAICFWHQNPPTGYRLIRKSEDGNWLESQPNGMTYQHGPLGRVTQGPFRGTILKRVENPRDEPWPVQLFIPDQGSHNVLLYRQDSASSWKYVSILEESTDNCPRLSPSARR